MEDHEDVLADYPMLRLTEASTLVLTFFVIPALLMLVLSTRARSEVRTERSEFLLLLGVSRTLVRGILALEGAVLAGVGALAGAFVHVLIGPTFTTVPLTGTNFLPGALQAQPFALLDGSALVVATAAFACAAGRLEPSLRLRPMRRVSGWRAVPVLLGTLAVASTALLKIDGTALFVVGVLFVALGLPVSAAWFAQQAARVWGRRPDPAVWMASARIVHDPQRAARVAALLGLSVFLGATSVSMYLGPMGGMTSGSSSSSGAAAAYSVDWLDGRDGDLMTLTQRMADIDDAVLVLPVGHEASADDYRVPAVGLDDCATLEPLAGFLGGAPCDSSGAPTSQVRDTFREALDLEIVETSGLVGGSGSGDSQVISAALLLADHSVSAASVHHAGAPLPGFNPADLMSTRMSWGVIAGWIAAVWAISVLTLGAAVLRELIEHAREVHRDTRRLVLIGLEPAESARVGRWTLLIPIAATIPVSFVCGLLASFFGTGPEVTRYTPAWITLYTVIALVMTGVAVAAGGLMTAADRRRGRRTRGPRALQR
ncbi:hypothetical protein LEP48_12780 [Isoptericola sp. NEAU-Y5]|uniref:ABC3 transporter permease protein domain-containing protein n=1 Tax=Isoptericola luteus TaxID=2879484 RepID=A0ABS7ZIS5_9MICO|nr:hypothetical protein [Isoptericola sp. NEAU-Y5]MCA5894216.1 hypothetical protein [Isoptericola sp. NEAU-Y5]